LTHLAVDGLIHGVVIDLLVEEVDTIVGNHLSLAVSTYSFHRFGGGPEGDHLPSMEEMIDRCADLGINGLEIIGNHLDVMERTSPKDIAELRQYMATRGIAPVSVSAHHNFVQPDPVAREAELDKLVRWIDVAHEIGAPFVRAFGGRWGTTKSFKAFMEANGEEPPLEGYTLDDAYSWTAECFRTAAYYAGRKGITLGLENHWGLTGTAEGTLRIFNDVASPWMKLVLDTGNFIHAEDMYAEMGKMLPGVALVHAKTYVGGSMYFGDFEIDYVRLAKMLADVGYKGYVSIEFEGLAMPDEGIAESVTSLRSAFQG
jgi:sugar phosphate isomerase/epimerase